MKVVIAGSRTISNNAFVYKAIENSGFKIDEVVCGCAIGVDRIGQQWAILNDVPVKEFPADWNTYGNAAGVIRNVKMADYADAAIIIINGKSLVEGKTPGSLNMIKEIKKFNKPYFIDILV
jgi:YspA, cpYpsA-related SLOG family